MPPSTEPGEVPLLGESPKQMETGVSAMSLPHGMELSVLQ